MDEQQDGSRAKRFPLWVAIVGPALGIATSRAIWQFYPPMSDTVRETIVAVVAVLIAAFLTYAIHRFSRM
ncbi:hypothetical protein [Sphingomonas sp.]|uniref:hypothetical protein n=1 Tax=Sphingomonas sp. TaxID=28214 RepID=UPI0018539AD8|nr:hypothetical protein [Sphingomonas sp.]MBA4762750.1 hypothetical protein [Sphingomonas sp.]